MTETPRDAQNGEHREYAPDPWSTPIEQDESDSTETAGVEGGDSPGVASSTAPSSGVADTAPQDAAAALAGAAQDGPEHAADFADGYDDRQEDAKPGAERETPEEVAERDRGER